MSNKITLTQLIEELSDESVIPKSRSQEFINSLIETTLEEVNEKGKSAITNFGSFTVVEVAERTGVNPKTGDPLIIPAHKRISFTPYKALEKKVNRDFDHLEAQVVDQIQSEQKPEPIESKPEPELERPKNEAERLLDALISEETQEEAEENTTLEEGNFEDDPFNLGEEETEDDSPAELTIEELEELEEDIQDEEVEEEGPTEVKAFRTPGRPERKSNAISPTILLSVLAVFVLGVFAVWFFFLRPDPAPQMATSNTDTQDILNDPSAFENDQVLNEISDASQTGNEEAVDDSESQIIPMIADDVDLSENPGEMMTIENQEPQIEYERFTGISYNVSAGVWIYEIARQTYGNTRLWPLIFQANYTLANNPDLILPNIELNIPQLEGSASDPSANDYMKLAEAARYVAQAYENAGNADQAAAYLKAADWYETMQ